MTWTFRSLSVSQAEKFDHAQYGGCQLKWWKEYPQQDKPPQSDAQSDGDKGHELLSQYFKTGNPPEGRVKMGTAVRAAVLNPDLPIPIPELLVERRFDGTDRRVDENGKWIPFIPDKTLWLGGVPWDGFVDLQWWAGGKVHIMDHKFQNVEKDDAGRVLWRDRGALLDGIQMPVYAVNALRIWPDAQSFRLMHHKIARSGTDSIVTREVVTRDQVLERAGAIERMVNEMRQVSTARASDVPFNRKSCDAYGGCPHQSKCPAFKENAVMLTDEEKALFGEVATPAVTTSSKKMEITITSGFPAKQAKVGERYKLPDGRIVTTLKVLPDAEIVQFQAEDGKKITLDDTETIEFAPAPIPTGKETTSTPPPLAPNVPSGTPAPVAVETAAVIPPDAPANSADVAPPEKAKRGRSKKMESVEVPLTAAQSQQVGQMLNASEPPKSVVIEPAPTAPVSLGDRAKDVITGFVGLVTGRCEYLTGCAQFLLQPPVKENGDKPDAHWFDETRIEIMARQAVKLPARSNDGPDQPAPIK